MYTGENNELDYNYWDARISYNEITGDLRNKIRRGKGKRQQVGAIATTSVGNGYLRVNDWFNGELVRVSAHRLAVFLHTGIDPGDNDINHKNQDKTDNRIKNLEVLPREDHRRKHPKQKNCTSGITGVSRHSDDKGWNVNISPKSAKRIRKYFTDFFDCLLYTSPSPRDRTRSRMPSSA